MILDRYKRDQIMALVDERLTNLGLECLEVEWDSFGPALRIYIDKHEGGVSFAQCSAASHALLECAELDGLTGSQDYHLEVSSPGVERPVRKLQHLAKLCGEQIELRLNRTASPLKQKKLRGEVLGVNETEATLQLATKDGTLNIAHGWFEDAHVIYDWSKRA